MSDRRSAEQRNADDFEQFQTEQFRRAQAERAASFPQRTADLLERLLRAAKLPPRLHSEIVSHCDEAAGMAAKQERAKA